MVCCFEFGFSCVGLKFGFVLLWNLMLAIAVCCVSAPSRVCVWVVIRQKFWWGVI